MNFRSNILLLLVGLTAACSSNTLASSEPVAITIEGHDIRYQPETIEVTAGQPVKLIFENVGALDHDINFDRLPTAEEQLPMSHEGGSHEDNHEGEHEHNATASHEVTEEHDNHSHNPAEEADENHTHHEAVLHVHTGSGEQASVTFTPTEPGTYEFYCTVPGHREAGMIGQLTVTAP